MREHHERVLLDDEILIRKTLVQLVTVFIKYSAERDGDISKGDDNIASDVGIFRGLEDLEEESVVLVAEG